MSTVYTVDSWDQKQCVPSGANVAVPGWDPQKCLSSHPGQAMVAGLPPCTAMQELQFLGGNGPTPWIWLPILGLVGYQVQGWMGALIGAGAAFFLLDTCHACRFKNGKFMMDDCGM